MQSSHPPVKDLVLLGGGHAHIQVIKMLAMQPIKGLRMTLISDVLHAPYSGMLPGFLAEFYSFDDIHFDLVKVASASGSRLIHGTADRIAPDRQEVQLNCGRVIPYDVLSVNVGCVPTIKGEIDLNQILPLKPISQFLSSWQTLIDSLAHRSTPPKLAVVGAGAAGFEIALILHRKLKTYFPEGQVVVLDGAQRILPHQPAPLSHRLKKIADREGIILYTGETVDRLQQGILTTSSGRQIEIDQALWATGAAPPVVLTNSPLQKDQAGFMKVDETLAAKGFATIFGAGDGIAFPTPLPKAGVYSVREGPILAQNLRAHLLGRPLRPYRPQKTALALITAGNKEAFASKGFYFGRGTWLWRLKDKIDREFMTKWQTYPPMAESVVYRDELPTDHLVNDCGGCGSKIVPQVVLPYVEKRRRVVEDAAEIPAVQGTLWETVDLLPTFISDPYLFGRIATLHCLSDLYAMRASPKTAQVLLQLPSGPEMLQQRDFAAVMAGVVQELESAQVDLVGGHSGVNPVTQLGFALTGAASQSCRKDGANPGDAIILTKPLGSGTLLRALMQGELSARGYQELLATLTQSNKIALEIPGEFMLTAMTDVTGFGFAGHLAEVARQSQLGAEITVSNLPVMRAFDDLATTVVPTLRTSLQHYLTHQQLDPGDANLPHSVCDPQTNGGLLICTAPDQAHQLVQFLRDQGASAAAMVGVMTSESKNGLRFV